MVQSYTSLTSPAQKDNQQRTRCGKPWVLITIGQEHSLIAENGMRGQFNDASDTLVMTNVLADACIL